MKCPTAQAAMSMANEHHTKTALSARAVEYINCFYAIPITEAAKSGEVGIDASCTKALLVGVIAQLQHMGYEVTQLGTSSIHIGWGDAK